MTAMLQLLPHLPHQVGSKWGKWGHQHFPTPPSIGVWGVVGNVGGGKSRWGKSGHQEHGKDRASVVCVARYPWSGHAHVHNGNGRASTADRPRARALVEGPMGIAAFARRKRMRSGKGFPDIVQQSSNIGHGPTSITSEPSRFLRSAGGGAHPSVDRGRGARARRLAVPRPRPRPRPAPTPRVSESKCYRPAVSPAKSGLSRHLGAALLWACGGACWRGRFTGRVGAQVARGSGRKCPGTIFLKWRD